MAGFPDLIDNRRQICPHLAVSDTNSRVSVRRKSSVANEIMASFMRLPIDFYNEPQFDATKIGNISTKGMLPPKLIPVKLPPLQFLPQRKLRPRHIPPTNDSRPLHIRRNAPYPMPVRPVFRHNFPPIEHPQ
jgi:hypothetical protein